VGQKVLHPLCVEALEEYLEWMRGLGRGHGPEDWMFQPTRNPSNPTHLNKPLNPRTINEIVTSYGKKIGLNFSISPHSARATFIGQLLEAGVDIYSVAREVNHSSVKTTQEYDKRRKKLSDSPIAKLRY
ncbi:MAG: site-specific integrase, partial [Halobacteriovoraceae bacterium]|nr:site-specific integrase [Halobacteriovoraceae bacterium]